MTEASNGNENNDIANFQIRKPQGIAILQDFD